MAAYMAFSSMCNWLLSISSMIILTKYIHCGSPIGDWASLFDLTIKSFFDTGRTNTRLIKAFAEVPMYSSTLQTYPFLFL